MSDFKVGQKVWCLLNGEGTVVSTNNGGQSYPILVKFADNMEDTYTEDGKMGVGHVDRCLYFSKPVVTGDTEPPFVPAFEVGEKLVLIHKKEPAVMGTRLITVKEESKDYVSGGHTLFFPKSAYDFYRLGEKVELE